MEEGLKELPKMEKEVEKVVDIRDILYKFKGAGLSESGVHAIHSLSD